MNAETVKRPLLIPGLLALLFFGPLLLAIVLYSLGDGWRPAGSIAHGQLLSSPYLLPEAATDQAAAGAPVALRGQWLLIYPGPADCADSCRRDLITTRQVRRALGKEMQRVRRIFVATDGLPDLEFLAREHPMLAVVGPHGDSAGLLPADLVLEPGDVLLADPLGNVIMRFPAGTTMKDMHADLKLLLKASHIG